MTTFRTLPTTSARVSAALNISPDRHIEFFFDLGYEYLMKYQVDALKRIPAHQIKNLLTFTKMFVQSPVFWFWWKLEFEKTDRAFLASTATGLDAYIEAHNTRNLVPTEQVINQIITLAHSRKKVTA